ncbi:MAG TPA: RNB domain-containing ribonuclease [Bacteroidota bacterium]|nr:RNB domain-containing ribonuclease [Bacteroidota bacterium]
MRLYTSLHVVYRLEGDVDKAYYPMRAIRQIPLPFSLPMAAHAIWPCAKEQTARHPPHYRKLMTDTNDGQHRAILRRIARRAMLERGLLPDFSQAAIAELNDIQGPASPAPGNPRDRRSLLWCSIDNDDSRDLDQLTAADTASGGAVRILVAIADVDALVRKDSAIDGHARHNTTSVYTTAEIFPMLPERLSTDLTSLGAGEDRTAMVVEMLFDQDGALQSSDIYRAVVHNWAKLAYPSVAAWLEGTGPMPSEIAAVAGLQQNLLLQDQMAQKLKALRHEHGALSLETLEARPVFDADELKDFQLEVSNRAKDIIEDFMIAANGVSARYLASKSIPSLRRVVRTPKRWDRIVELARGHGGSLPGEPDSVALERFLASARASDPLRFPDLSLSVIKLMGPGEYMTERPGDDAPGHFGLAVRDYTHSTAPNRRYPDLITQRSLKAAIAQAALPYTADELDGLAANCTAKEDAAKKVERQVQKSAAAMLLESHIGDQYDALVTGSAEKGTWVRLLPLPVEAKLVRGFEGLDVGDRLRVQLVDTDVERGFIDVKKVG